VLHGGFLRAQGHAEYASIARALAHNRVDDASLSDQDRAMLAYARKLNDAPHAITDDDITSLHAAGLTDEQVWETTFTVSIFNMFNRMADAFGLEPPEHAVAALQRP
jgi:uncharacterized peroxidase-related enzyme